MLHGHYGGTPRALGCTAPPTVQSGGPIACCGCLAGDGMPRIHAPCRLVNSSMPKLNAPCTVSFQAPLLTVGATGGGAKQLNMAGSEGQRRLFVFERRGESRSSQSIKGEFRVYAAGRFGLSFGCLLCGLVGFCFVYMQALKRNRSKNSPDGLNWILIGSYVNPSRAEPPIFSPNNLCVVSPLVVAM